jgi:hypothetical protein
MTKSRFELDKKGRPDAQSSESTIYLDRDAVGSILVVKKGRVTALDAAGKRLGVYKSDREAMAAILRAARALREMAK